MLYLYPNQTPSLYNYTTPFGPLKQMQNLAHTISSRYNKYHVNQCSLIFLLHNAHLIMISNIYIINKLQKIMLNANIYLNVVMNVTICRQCK